jgi:dihydroorotate dehydrogenase
MSGAPLEARALEVPERVRARAGARLCPISAGGVATPEDALEASMRARPPAGPHRLLLRGPFLARASCGRSRPGARN